MSNCLLSRWFNYRSDDLSFLTTVQLKEVLKFFSLKTSGKKQDLIERIQEHENIDDALKSLNLYKERFVLTSIGKQTIKFLPKSITKNLEFEDKCLSLIMNQNFNEAYKEICNWERQKTYSRGVGIDWEREYSIGLDNDKSRIFLLFWEADISSKLPEQCLDYVPQIKSCIILGNMLGVAIDKIICLITRIIPNITKNEELVRKIQNIQFLLMDVEQLKSFYDLLHN